MRDAMNLVAILDAITVATPAPPSVEPVSFFNPFPGMRRTLSLMKNERADVLRNLAVLLASATDTPDWMSQKAMDAVLPDGTEAELDEPSNHVSLLERAALVMGLDPACVCCGDGRSS